MSKAIKSKKFLKILKDKGATIRRSGKNHHVVYLNNNVVTLSIRNEYPTNIVKHAIKNLL
jgi:hypothetical protein